MDIQSEIKALCLKLNQCGLERTPADVEWAILDNVDIEQPLKPEIMRVIEEFKAWHLFASYMKWRGTDIPKFTKIEKFKKFGMDLDFEDDS